MTIEASDRVAAFQYDPAFARSGVELSPIVMPLGDRVYTFPALPHYTFHGLPRFLRSNARHTFDQDDLTVVLNYSQ